MENKKMGVDQFAELMAGFVRNFPRDLSPEAAQYWIEHPDQLQAVLGTVPGKKPAGNSIFTVTVDSALSLAEMIAAGKYDRVNSDITQRNFPLKSEGKKNVMLRLIHLGKAMSTEAVLAELDQRGLRPATMAELLTFGAKYPEEQRKYPVVALGSVWVGPSGFRFVAYLGGDSGKRSLRLRWYEFGWRDIYRFLAAGK